jgi:hypothetical protein
MPCPEPRGEVSARFLISFVGTAASSFAARAQQPDRRGEELGDTTQNRTCVEGKFMMKCVIKYVAVAITAIAVLGAAGLRASRADEADA